jgi:hypothetical protein
MMVLVAIFCAGAQLSELPVAASPEEFANELAQLVLDGQDLPHDYRTRLLSIDATQRMFALVLLRRSGLLTGDAWDLRDLLVSPSSDQTE